MAPSFDFFYSSWSEHLHQLLAAAGPKTGASCHLMPLPPPTPDTATTATTTTRDLVNEFMSHCVLRALQGKTVDCRVSGSCQDGASKLTVAAAAPDVRMTISGSWWQWYIKWRTT